jgi:hypothetical protein
MDFCHCQATFLIREKETSIRWREMNGTARTDGSQYTESRLHNVNQENSGLTRVNRSDCRFTCQQMKQRVLPQRKTTVLLSEQRTQESVPIDVDDPTNRLGDRDVSVARRTLCTLPISVIIRTVSFACT